MHEIICFQRSIAKDTEVMMDMRLQCGLMKMPGCLMLAMSPGALMLAMSPGALVCGVLLRYPVMIITMP